MVCVHSKRAHHWVLPLAWPGGWTCMGGGKALWLGLLQGGVARCCERPVQQVHAHLAEGKGA